MSMITLTRLAVAAAVSLGAVAYAEGSAFAQGAAPAPAPSAAAPAPSAAAPSSNCPPGSWFCAEAPGQAATPAGQPVQPLQPLPDPNAKPPIVTYQSAPPPVVVYQPPPPVYVYHPREAPPPAYVYAPRPTYPRPHEWGLNLHLEGAMLGHGYSGNAGMGGIGLGLRYKPVPAVGIEGNLDFLGGRDYNGDSRGETALTFNGLIFLNPRSHAQVYLLAGFGWSAARVTQSFSGYENDVSYGYFGGQLGAGMEFRLSQHFALNVDLRGFVRGRVDGGTSQPEFVDPATGRTTNTSGGGLLTGGCTFYF